jgi:hypothetical protein
MASPFYNINIYINIVVITDIDIPIGDYSILFLNGTGGTKSHYQSLLFRISWVYATFLPKDLTKFLFFSYFICH